MVWANRTRTWSWWFWFSLSSLPSQEALQGAWWPHRFAFHPLVENHVYYRIRPRKLLDFVPRFARPGPCQPFASFVCCGGRVARAWACNAFQFYQLTVADTTLHRSYILVAMLVRRVRAGKAPCRHRCLIITLNSFELRLLRTLRSLKSSPQLMAFVSNAMRIMKTLGILALQPTHPALCFVRVHARSVSAQPVLNHLHELWRSVRMGDALSLPLAVGCVCSHVTWTWKECRKLGEQWRAHNFRWGVPQPKAQCHRQIGRVERHIWSVAGEILA